MNVFVYPGSFDPVTNGHLDIIKRVLPICDKLIVAVLNNGTKTSAFTVGERVDMIKEVLKSEPKVEVDSFDKLLVDYMRLHEATTVVRGLRAVSDFENEFMLALLNKNQYPKMETIFMLTNQKYFYLSSHMVKELAMYGGNIDEYVPEIVKAALMRKYCA
jgi:pantetheine-phosphate adenylyltransferase